MPAWKEIHYARAQEFIRLMADLTAPSPTAVESRPKVAGCPMPIPPPGCSTAGSQDHRFTDGGIHV